MPAKAGIHDLLCPPPQPRHCERVKRARQSILLSSPGPPPHSVIPQPSPRHACEGGHPRLALSPAPTSSLRARKTRAEIHLAFIPPPPHSVMPRPLHVMPAKAGIHDLLCPPPQPRHCERVKRARQSILLSSPRSSPRHSRESGNFLVKQKKLPTTPLPFEVTARSGKRDEAIHLFCIARLERLP
jgi:hypothetical protein